MIKRIDLFMPTRSQYGVLHHFTKKIGEALTRAGINCRILEAQYNNPKPFLEALLNDRPDCTLSFNGVLPDEQGRFLCEMIQIPHVAYLVDSQNQFVPLSLSPKTIICCIDRYSCEYFGHINCRNVLFSPHAVERELAPNHNLDPIYDVTMLNSLIDYNKIREEWKGKYDRIICKAMDEAAEITLSDNITPYPNALAAAVDRQMELNYALDPRKINFIAIMDDLEQYIKGKSRIDLIKSIKDAKVHIFGSSTEGASWEKYLGKELKNVVIHDAVPYQQAIEVMQQSKIVLCTIPWVKDGAHERIFTGLACGALVLTNNNKYISENFKDGENIALFENGALSEVNNIINEYLSNNRKRETVADCGREVVMRNHTWDHRVKKLLQELDPILEAMKAS